MKSSRLKWRPLFGTGLLVALTQRLKRKFGKGEVVKAAPEACSTTHGIHVRVHEMDGRRACRPIAQRTNFPPV
jgi:hypothetical protein